MDELSQKDRQTAPEGSVTSLSVELAENAGVGKMFGDMWENTLGSGKHW